jgi:hypothetical protein
MCTALAKLLRSIMAVVAFLGAAAVEARTTPIDNGTDQAWGNADDGQSIALPSPINFGTGYRSAVTIHFGDQYKDPSGSGLTLAPVSLSIDGAPGDSLYATVMGLDPSEGSAVVVVSNPGGDTSKPQFIDPASIFNFADEYWYHGQVIPNIGSIYGPISGSAQFQFTDLSSTGAAGDFQLLLTCSGMCTNIGFNLGGVSFSASSFDPSAAPSQLVSYDVNSAGPGVTQGSWDFIFRNTAAVPEPRTWALMLLGFGFIGCIIRRHPVRSTA